MSMLISVFGFPAKPATQEEYKRPRKCRNLQIFEGTVSELADKISQGYTVYTNVLDLNPTSGWTVKSENFQESEWIGLDFDNCKDGVQLQPPRYLTMEDCIAKMKNMGLYPTIVYPTFSFTPERHKFRVLFHLNEVITKANQRKLCILLEMLMTLFPTCDSSCKDFARMFFGTNQPISTFYIDADARLNEQTLWQQYVCSANDSVSSSSDKSKKWQSLARHWAVNMITSPLMPNVITEESNPIIDFEFIDGYAEKSFSMAKSYKNPESENDINSDEQSAAEDTNSSTTTTPSRRRHTNNVPRSNEEFPPSIRLRNWEEKLLWMSKLYKAFVEGERKLNETIPNFV